MSFFRTKPTATPLPETTTTTSRGPDLYEYERSFTQGRIKDSEIEILKNCVRINFGLPLPNAPKRKRIPKPEESPQITPKSNETSRMRLQLHAYRVLRLCGTVLDKISPEEEKMLTFKEPLSEELKAKLLKAREWNMEQLEEAFEKVDLERLRRTAMTAHETGPFKENNSSTFRYQRLRQQPIVTDFFRRSYNRYGKPPFELSWRYTVPSAKGLPAIDKKKQIWLIPVEEDDSTPLHMQQKSPEKDTRSKREKARPPLKKYKKPVRTPIKPESLIKKPKRLQRKPIGGKTVPTKTKSSITSISTSTSTPTSETTEPVTAAPA